MSGEKEEKKKKNRKKISNYVICFDKLLGQGAVGQVFLCYHVSNPEQAYAVKIIDKNKCTMSLIKFKEMTI